MLPKAAQRPRATLIPRSINVYCWTRWQSKFVLSHDQLKLIHNRNCSIAYFSRSSFMQLSVRILLHKGHHRFTPTNVIHEIFDVTTYRYSIRYYNPSLPLRACTATPYWCSVEISFYWISIRWQLEITKGPRMAVWGVLWFWSHKSAE